MSSAEEIIKALKVKGLCPACDGEFNVNQDETIRQHAVHGHTGYDCPGSWVRPERLVVDAAALRNLIFKTVPGTRGRRISSR